MSTPRAAPRARGKIKARTSQEQANRDLAIYHANILKQKAELQNKMLHALVELIDFPSDKQADPLKPSYADFQRVKELLQYFQPSEYDELIAERNRQRDCGYVLCPRKHRDYGPSGSKRIITKPAFKVVAVDDLQKWCSDVCGKHALYLKVQLDECATEPCTDLQLYGEAVLKVKQYGNTDARKLQEDLNQLAIERGDSGAKSFNTESIKVGVVEKSSDETPRAPEASGDHGIVDGYLPGRAKSLAADLKKLTVGSGEGEDLLDTI